MPLKQYKITCDVTLRRVCSIVAEHFNNCFMYSVISVFYVQELRLPLLTE